MANLANDKFGITYFADSAGKIWFNRKAATATTVKLGDCAVAKQLANWYKHKEFRDHYTATVTTTGSGGLAH